MELNPLHLMLAFLFGVWIGGLSGYSFGLKIGTRDTINILESRVEARLNKISKALDAAVSAKEGDESEGERMKRAYGLPAKEGE